MTDVGFNMQITKQQIYDMNQALGTDKDKPFDIKKSYRNRFYTYSDDESWNELVKKGLATKRTEPLDGEKFNMCYFHVSNKGIEFLQGLNKN